MANKKSVGYMYKGYWVEQYEKAFDVVGSRRGQIKILILWRILSKRAGGPVVKKNIRSEEEARRLIDEGL